MKKKIRITVLLQGVILANWVLSKLLNALMQESVEEIEETHKVLVFIEPNCSLDDVLDGTRDSLKSWNRA